MLSLANAADMCIEGSSTGRDHVRLTNYDGLVKCQSGLQHVEELDLVIDFDAELRPAEVSDAYVHI
jgi:hypothetical protein